MVRLGLQLDGAPFTSLSSLNCPVTLGGNPAFLKVTNEPEELAGARALERWGGDGAVHVLARDGNAIVLERAGRTLRSVVSHDIEATRIICAVADRLHRHRVEGLEDFPTLRVWFSSLFADTSPRFDQVREIAGRLLEHHSQPVLLHGDLHHENVLHHDERGWLAIDPKGLLGPREFDYCTIFTNPSRRLALTHFDARLKIVAATAHIDHADLLCWIAAWSALSATWDREDAESSASSFSHVITEIALDRLRTHTR